MLLFISDIHLGRDDAVAERANERDLMACLEHHAPALAHLYLVGDVFDQYIEYRSLAPKGFVRFQALLARLTDTGLPVTYLLGNHDPWHRTYFEAELGVRIIPGALSEQAGGVRLHLEHGDGLDPDDRLYNRLKPLVRHRLPLWLYTNLLPGDAGYGFARWVKHKGRTENVEESRVQSLRDHARSVMAATGARAVVMGHSHFHELLRWPEGAYLNPGYWHDARTYGTLADGHLHLLRWNGTCPQEIQVESVT